MHGEQMKNSMVNILIRVCRQFPETWRSVRPTGRNSTKEHSVKKGWAEISGTVSEFTCKECYKPSPTNWVT